VSFEIRVDTALAKIIAKQMRATRIVDNKALNEGIFISQLGGTKRANTLFEQPITDILAQFNKALWHTAR